MSNPSLHIIVFPWSAFGHMIPFLQLSIALAKSGVRVSYISTPRNIERLPLIPQTLANLLTYLQLPLPKLKELPEDAEATVDLTVDQIQYLKVAYDLLEKPFSQIIYNLSPDWIITDFASYWAPKAANFHGVPHMFFAAFTAASRCFLGSKEYLADESRIKFRPNAESLMSKPPWVPFESSVFFRAHEAARFLDGPCTPNASGISDTERLAKVLEGCQAITIRSCREFEGEYLELYEKCIEKPVVPAGLLPPDEQLSNETRDELDGKWSEVLKWMDEQRCKSVVFVGFGSEYKVTKEDVHEIAYGLELSDLPYLWIVENTNALPEGFRDRSSGKGLVCVGLAPQHKILAHSSIGCCFFDGGWASIIETLQYGHSLVVLPFIVDQGLNARLLVDKGLAIEVEKKEDWSFTRNGVARALRRAMVEEEGVKIRDCAKNASKVFGDVKLHQECYIGELVEYLKNGTRKPSIKCY